MKKALILSAAALTLSLTQAAELTTENDKISYTIGSQIGQSLKDVDGTFKLSREALFEAINTTLDAKELKMTSEQMNEVMQIFGEKRIEAQKKAQEEAVTKNAEEGKKLLADNQKVDGVKVTSSGLQYRVITEGKGAKPVETDTVSVHYEGTLADGKVFDSSYKRDKPVEFPLNGVIKGWTEGLQLMTVGSTYEFLIPAELAYGERGPGQIGPNRTLKFKVELLDIVDVKKREAEQKAMLEKAKAETKSDTEGKPTDAPVAEAKPAS